MKLWIKKKFLQIELKMYQNKILPVDLKTYQKNHLQWVNQIQKLNQKHRKILKQDLKVLSKINHLTSDGSKIEEVVDKQWKNLLKNDIKLNIDYIENHFPKSDIEYTKYIDELIHQVKKENVNFSQEILSLRSKLTIHEMRAANAIAQKTELWIEEMEEKLKILE